MHSKFNMFISKLMKMEHSIKFAVIYLCGHVCVQFYTWRTENSVRFANISIHANGK